MAAEIRQLDGLAFARRERRQRLAHGFGLGEIDDAALELVDLDHRAAGVAFLTVATGRLGTQQIDTATVDLGEEIGAEAAARGVETIGSVPEPYEHFLDDLFGEGAIAEHAAGQTKAGIRVDVVDRTERLLVAPHDGIDEPGVMAPAIGVGARRARAIIHLEGSSERTAGLDACGPRKVTTFDPRLYVAPMQLVWPPEAVAAREEVTRFLAGLAGPDGRFPADAVAQLAQAGYGAPHWPRPWGRDAGPWEQLAIDDALRAAGAPKAENPIGIGWAGPTILAAGTPDQQRRWLPSLLDGSELWCQLFSEPEAGSDLASLRTTATADGDEFVVQGQKVWTTLAHVARWGILLARTRNDPNVGDQQSITYFVVDMRSPGITVQPLVQMTGTHEFNEVFFDAVRVPAANVIGTVDDGWRLAKVTLANERVSLSGEGALWGRGPTAHDVLDLVRGRGGAADPATRQRLARLYTEARILEFIRMRTLLARLAGREPGPEASVRKALSDPHGQHVMREALALAGTDGLLAQWGPCGDPSPMWPYGFFYSAALTIGGGTSEVQRNILGERVLGLPK